MSARKTILWAAVAATGLLGFSVNSVQAGNVSIQNCFGQQIRVGAYNSNDALRAIAYQDACIASGRSATLACATSQCAIKLWNGCSPSISNFLSGGPYSGSHVYHNGQLGNLTYILIEAAERGIVKKGTKTLTCAEVTKALTR